MPDIPWPPSPTGPLPPVIGPNEMIDLAEKEAERLRLWPGWEAAFAGARAGAPILVERLDHAGWYYYLVPFSAGGGVTARLRMNAHTGKYSEAIAVDSATDSLPRYLSQESIQRRIILRPWEWLEPSRKKKKTVAKTLKPHVIVFKPFLVWRPCLQSLTAFQPFYYVEIDNLLRYYRVDGQVSADLTLGAGH